MQIMNMTYLKFYLIFRFNIRTMQFHGLETRWKPNWQGYRKCTCLIKYARYYFSDNNLAPAVTFNKFELYNSYCKNEMKHNFYSLWIYNISITVLTVGLCIEINKRDKINCKTDTNLSAGNHGKDVNKTYWMKHSSNSSLYIFQHNFDNGFGVRIWNNW